LNNFALVLRVSWCGMIYGLLKPLYWSWRWRYSHTWCQSLGSRPVGDLSHSPKITITLHQVCSYLPSHRHLHPLTSTKLYCLVTEAHVCEQLAQDQWNGRMSNPQWPVDHRCSVLTMLHSLPPPPLRTIASANQPPLPRLPKRRWYVLCLLSGAISITWLYLFFTFTMPHRSPKVR